MNETGENSIAKWLVIAGRQISQHLDQRLNAIGVSASQYFYILKIHDNPGLTQKELIESEFINPSSVTRAIKQLVDQGLVIRQPAPFDKRAQQLKLTEQGEKIYPQIDQILNQEEAQVSESAKAAFPEFDKQQFVGVLHIISHLHGDTDKQ